MKLKRRNAQESSSEGNGGNGQSNVVLEESGYQSGRGGEETDAGGKAVHSIDQIEGICAADQPKYGDRDGTPGGEMVPGDAANLDASPNGDGGSGELSCEFLPGLEP